MRKLVLLLGLGGCVHAPPPKSVEEQYDDACREPIAAGKYPDRDYCIFAIEHPDGDACVRQAPTKEAAQECVWAVYHPVEAGCQEEVRKLGGNVWDCIKVRNDQQEHASDRQLQKQLHEDDVARSSARAQSTCVTNNVAGTLITNCH